jgi:hypothetical protein
MTKVSLAAQTQIDRLRPILDRHIVDRSKIEAALSQHYVELGLPAPKITWAADAAEGWRMAQAAAWAAARDAAWDAAWAAARDAAWDAARDAAWDAAWDAARGAARGAAWDAARDAARGAAWAAARDAAWDAARGAARGAAWDAARACGEVNALSAFDHPAAAKLAAIWLPFIDAFEAGLFLYWTTADGIIAVERPSLKVEDDRLHSSTGPAVSWPTGEAYYFWRGAQVPGEWITDPASITPKVALTWRNMEQRRAAVEIVGWARILGELGAKTINADADPQIGTLVEVSLPDAGRARFVRVQCGTGREFAICVPPDTKTALDGQAWCAGLSPAQFSIPEVRT